MRLLTRRWSPDQGASDDLHRFRDEKWQVQNDTYGSVILAAMPMFYDRRLPRPGDEGLFRLLESLGAKAGELALEADNGIWEYRGRQRIHTHSTAMCWAGCHRLAAIASQLEPYAELHSVGPEIPLDTLVSGTYQHDASAGRIVALRIAGSDGSIQGETP